MRTGGRIALRVGGALVVAAAAGYWFATGGTDPSRSDFDWLTSAPIAHRGLHTGDSRVPENSLAAFEAAAEAGYAIELDVQITSDGTIVVCHEDDLERMTGAKKRISETPTSEVTRLRLLESTQTVPTLDQVLNEVRGRVPVFIEVKNEGAVGRLEDEVGKVLSTTQGKIALISFSPFSLARIAQAAPDVPRGQVSSSFRGDRLSLLEKVVLSSMLMNWKSRPDFIVYQLEGLPSFGTWLQRKRGRPLIVWTADTKAEYDRALALGDAVEFELAGRPRQ